MENERRPVFLSHTSKNKEIMLDIASYLEERDIPCWYAPRNIPYGEQYDLRIANDLEDVDVVIVLITEEVAESRHVPSEISMAVNYHKTIIPVIIDHAEVPKSLLFHLTNIQQFNMSDFPSEEEALEQLAAFLEELYQGKNERTEIEAAKPMKKPVVFNQKASSSLFQVDTLTINRTSSLFIAPAAFPKMKDILQEHHFIHLYNPLHIGKFSSAIMLLQALGVEDIYEWSKEVTIRQLLSHPIRPKAGFVIEVESLTEFMSKVSEHELERYIRKLRENHAFFIILSKEDSVTELADYAIRVTQPSNEKALLIKHAEWLEKDSELLDEIVNWIHSEKAGVIFTSHISPRKAVDFIRKIKQLLTGKIDEQEFVQSLDTSVVKRVKDWFNQPYTFKDISFYLNIGLFQGEAYEHLIGKSNEFLDLLMDHFNQEFHHETMLPSRDEYLQKFHAVAVKYRRQTNAGLEDIEGIRFLFPQDFYTIWEYVWTQFPDYQPVLVEWIRRLAQKTTRESLNNIIDLIVNLSKKDSHNVRNRFILPWANSKNSKEQLLAARILETLAEDEDYIHMVFTLTKSWVRLSNNDRLQWTGLVLLGTHVGGFFYSKSLALLRELYDSVNFRKISFSIQRSFEKLSQLATESKEYEKLFFNFWIDWYQSSNEQLVEVIAFSQTIFLSQPKLFFNSSMERQQDFWKEFLRISYINAQTRKTAEGMINRWIVSARTEEQQDWIAKILYSLYLDENQSNQNRLVYLIEKGLKKDEKFYRPIREKLL